MSPRGLLTIASLMALGGAACAGAPAVTLPSEPTCSGTLPLTLTNGLPGAPIEVNAVSLTLLVDSGGFDTVSLSAPAIEQVAPVLTGHTRKSENARGEKLVAREYRLARVALGPHAFTDVVGSESVNASESPLPTRTGYLGLGLLRHFHLMIDYGRGELGLIDRRCPAPELPEPPTWQRVTMESHEDGPRISATLDGHKRSLILDTGASYSTIRPDAAPTDKRRRASGWELYTPSHVVMGSGEITGLELAVIDLPGPGTDGILGCNFFAEHQVLIDFEHREVAFRRAAAPVPHPCPPPTAN